MRVHSASASSTDRAEEVAEKKKIAKGKRKNEPKVSNDHAQVVNILLECVVSTTARDCIVSMSVSHRFRRLTCKEVECCYQIVGHIKLRKETRCIVSKQRDEKTEEAAAALSFFISETLTYRVETC